VRRCGGRGGAGAGRAGNKGGFGFEIRLGHVRAARSAFGPRSCVRRRTVRCPSLLGPERRVRPPAYRCRGRGRAEPRGALPSQRSARPAAHCRCTAHPLLHSGPLAPPARAPLGLTDDPGGRVESKRRRRCVREPPSQRTIPAPPLWESARTGEGGEGGEGRREGRGPHRPCSFCFRAQNWYWTQSITTRRPHYKANRYVCWSSAWFQPDQETYGSHTLVLNSGGCMCGGEGVAR
jgi:hypothetical protein